MYPRLSIHLTICPSVVHPSVFRSFVNNLLLWTELTSLAGMANVEGKQIQMVLEHIHVFEI